MFRKEMTFITNPPTGLEPLIAPGFNPGIREDYEVQANPKGVEHPQIKQILSLVGTKGLILLGGSSSFPKKRDRLYLGFRMTQTYCHILSVYGKF